MQNRQMQAFYITSEVNVKFLAKEKAFAQEKSIYRLSKTIWEAQEQDTGLWKADWDGQRTLRDKSCWMGGGSKKESLSPATL